MPRTRRVLVRDVTYLGFGTYLSLTLGACRREKTDGGPDAGLAVAKKPGPASTRSIPATLELLTPDEFVTLMAATECLLPRDEDPGAIDLGVAEFIDRALAKPELASLRDAFRAGLQQMDVQSVAQFGKAFHLADPASQEKLLKVWQSGPPLSRQFFAALHTLTLEGAFGDPIHGGNRGGKGFEMIGFAPPPPSPGHAHGRMDHPQGKE